MAYESISSYGIIGDMHSAALVSTNGSIDWLCMPRFDSPSVFAAILDDKKGGFFQVRPAEERTSNHKQFYWPNTNVLVTRFLQPGAAAELIDFMPVRDGSSIARSGRQVIRIITADRGPNDVPHGVPASVQLRARWSRDRPQRRRRRVPRSVEPFGPRHVRTPAQG